MACCLNILDLGCYNSCEVIELPYSTNLPYVVIFDYGNRQYAYEYTPTGSENIKIDLTKANENDCFKVSIIQNSNALNITIDNIAYDCFKIKTDYTTEIKPYDKLSIDCSDGVAPTTYDCWFGQLTEASGVLNVYTDPFGYPTWALNNNALIGIQINGINYNFQSDAIYNYEFSFQMQYLNNDNIIIASSRLQLETNTLEFSFTTKYNTITSISIIDANNNTYPINLISPNNISFCDF